MPQYRSPELHKSATAAHVPLLIGTGVTLISAAVLLGWAYEVVLLKSLMPAFTTMKVNTALGLVLLGTAIALDQTKGLVRTLGQFAALLAAAIGAVTLAEYLFDWDAYIDQALFTDRETAPQLHPGRPAHMSAFNFLVLGAAMLIKQYASGQRIAQAFGISALLIALVAVAGYIYDVEVLYGVTHYSNMALHTALLFLAVAAGVLWLVPDSWFRHVVSSATPVGSMARWLLPFTVMGPLAVGWLWLSGHRAGFYGNEFGWALAAVSSIVGSIGVIFFAGKRLVRVEADRARVRQELRKANDALRLQARKYGIDDVGRRQRFGQQRLPQGLQVER